MKDQERPWILGIASSHNGAVCLLHGDEVAVAVQEERLLRLKRAGHPAGYASLAIPYCLQYAGIEAADLSGIGVCAPGRMSDDIYLNPQLQDAKNGIPVVNVAHHLGHAIAAFATSGFDDAAVLIVDGNGSSIGELGEDEFPTIFEQQRTRCSRANPAIVETISTYSAARVAIRAIEKHVGDRTEMEAPTGMMPFFSLGRLFENVGVQVFGQPLDGPGKVMGLAPYGRPTIPVDAFFDIVEGEFVFRPDVPARYRHHQRWPQLQDEYMNLAASVQAALEHALLWLVRRLREQVASRQLCYAGGVALNSVANERIVREGGFDRVFIMPASEDSGTAIGAAYAALWHVTQRRSSRQLGHDSVGCRYAAASVASAVARHPAIRAAQPADVADEAARLLAEGKVVGWLQGGSELGPRALGQRSIFADPRDPDTKDRLNAEVKFREAFRPYAPVVLLEHAAEWFDTTPELAESPYMLRVMKFRPGCRDRVPAVVHVDETGRVQTVTAEANGKLFDLLTAFYRRTGIPMLLNTSFNTAGEPIVETPEDALWCLHFTGMDACVLEDTVVVKDEAAGAPMDWCPYLTSVWISHEYAAEKRRTDWHLRTPKRGMFFSQADGRTADLNRLADRHRMDHLRIKVDGPWGRVVHVTSAELLPMLHLMNGRRSGWEILEAVNRRRAEYTEAQFLRVLSRLARLSIIGLLQPSARKPAEQRLARPPRAASRARPAAAMNA